MNDDLNAGAARIELARAESVLERAAMLLAADRAEDADDVRQVIAWVEAIRAKLKPEAGR